jgi:serine/threonine-protein kinase
VGSRVGGYQLISLVGEGATGAVYLAEREGAPERVALKVLDADLAQDERFRRRLLRESTIAATLRHPHVVPILDFGESDDAVYLAMRHIDGCDLRELLSREGPLEPARAIDLLAQVADALDEAHKNGLVHRDVKPANILVEGVGEAEHAYLGDFGLAKHASSVSSLTGDHAFVGTLAYVFPEQITRVPAISTTPPCIAATGRCRWRGFRRRRRCPPLRRAAIMRGSSRWRASCWVTCTRRVSSPTIRRLRRWRSRAAASRWAA